MINSTTPGGFYTRSAAKVFMQETTRKIETGHLADLSIEIIEKEIDLSPESAIQATRDLIFRERVNIIVGPNVSISALAAASICELAKIPMISPGATNSAISAGKEYIFQVAFTDIEQGIALSDLMIEQLLAGSVSVIYQ
ncbi:MAG: ABC transporter substrate-binding protein, partial [Kangiellaceae bacterium]|nr:ABC transporter substrate-binding protein [Kangiellaceae bacterium]